MVFPAHAGVFLTIVHNQKARIGSSPRMRGCFRALLDYLVPILGLPRACGGVSTRTSSRKRPTRSSPRMRGCFYVTVGEVPPAQVFPAHAGVFLSACVLPTFNESLPRACGGVSLSTSMLARLSTSSPRMRGCFHHRVSGHRCVHVFPAHAGVFPRRTFPDACFSWTKTVFPAHAGVFLNACANCLA